MRFSPIAQHDPMENFSQICNVMLTTDLFLQLYGEGGWSPKTNHSKMGNLTQQHRGLAEYRVQPTTYTHKKLSNTTAEQKHRLSKGIWGFDLITAGKNTPLNLLKGAQRKDHCWQSQAYLPSYPQTPEAWHQGVKSPKGCQTTETFIFQTQHPFFKMRGNCKL